MTETTTVSVSVNEIPLPLLIQRVQTLGAQIDQIREERRYIGSVIAKRLKANEREHPQEAEASAGGVDASAPGAVIEASAKQG